MGKPYQYGAAGPSSFDCSGLTMYSWAAAGVSLPHSSSMQSHSGRQVSRTDLQPGDLVFFGSPISHVGIFVSGDTIIGAPTTGDVVRYQSISGMGMPYAGAVRP
jgi:cell wall-associated NlpC family hydrolase